MPPRCCGGSAPFGVSDAATPARDQKAPTSYAGRSRSGPLRAVAADAAVDEARIARVDGGEAEPGALERAQAQVRDQHVGAIEQRQRDGASLVVQEVDGDAALAAVVELERRVDRHVDAGRGEEQPAHRIAGRRLDLDHLGAPVGHDAGGRRAGDPEADLDDANAFEWTRHGRALYIGRHRAREAHESADGDLRRDPRSGSAARAEADL